MSVRAMTGPTLGTETSRSSLSHQAGEPRTASSISLSTLASSFSSALTSRAMLFFNAAGSCASHAGVRPRSSRRSADGVRPDRPAAAKLRPAGRAPAACRFGEMRDHGGVDRIGLGALPDRLAKARIWAGLAMTTGRPAPASAAAATVSKPPVASNATICGESSLNRLTNRSRPEPLRSTANASPLDARQRRDDLSKRRYQQR